MSDVDADTPRTPRDVISSAYPDPSTIGGDPTDPTDPTDRPRLWCRRGRDGEWLPRDQQPFADMETIRA